MGATSIIWAGYPKSWTKGRARKIHYVALHYTAGSEGPTSAEGGVSYDQRRTDGTSCHIFTDSAGPALCEVPDGDRSHAGRHRGNEIGIHIEVCGTRQTRAQWLDPVSRVTLETTAWVVSEKLKLHKLAFKLLSVAETRAAYYAPNESGPTGITDHARITQAYPEDNGTHMDMGTEFPWDVFMEMVAGFMGQPTPGGDEMFCKFGDKSNVVTAMQMLLLAVDPTCLPQFGADGGYGDETAKALVKLKLVGGDTTGKTYGPTEYSRLFTMLATVKGPVPVPPPATLVPHHHTGGATGPAVAG